jgi:hypothetical protein
MYLLRNQELLVPGRDLQTISLELYEIFIKLLLLKNNKSYFYCQEFKFRLNRQYFPFYLEVPYLFL